MRSAITPCFTVRHPISEPRDLGRHTLIHLDWPTGKGYWPTWDEWLDAAGVKSVDTTRGMRFTVHSHALRAAVEAQGVVLTTPLLVDADLRSGLLVKPFDLHLPTGTQTHVVNHRKRSDETAIQAFREWLLEEARDNPCRHGRTLRWNSRTVVKEPTARVVLLDPSLIRCPWQVVCRRCNGPRTLSGCALVTGGHPRRPASWTIVTNLAEFANVACSSARAGTTMPPGPSGEGHDCIGTVLSVGA